MSLDPRELQHRYLDDTLTVEEHTALAAWLREDPTHAREFAALVRLHSRLRDAFTAGSLATSVLAAEGGAPLASLPVRPRRLGRRSWLAYASLAGVALLAASGLFFWQSVSAPPVAAAVVELERLIVDSNAGRDRTFLITVEESLPAVRRGKRGPDGPESEASRPPKLPLDGARLAVRGPGQFVLERDLPGGPWLAGSDGGASWSVRPTGPVRVSADPGHFARDVPGHEHALPLARLGDGLARLRSAYAVEVLPVEASEGDAGDLRLLVAVRRAGERGPRRVEITYAVASGAIQQLRFIDMPFGPERLTLRLTLVSEEPLAENYFTHAAHHAPGRAIERED